MVTVEKPGNDELFAEHTYQETYKPKRFKCDVCECEFTATKGDYKKKWFSWNEFIGQYKYKVRCPHCLTKLVIYELDMDPLKVLDSKTQAINDTLFASEKGITHIPTSIKLVQKAGDNAVQVQVAKIPKKVKTFIENECSAKPPKQVNELNSRVWADGQIVHDPQKPTDFDVVSDDPSWMYKDFRGDVNVFALTSQVLREMHKQEEKEKEKCRRNT